MSELEFISEIVRSITDEPDCFDIEKSVDERGVLLTLDIDQAHAGRVIGKKGGTAMAIRYLLRALGTKNNAFYSLKINIRQP